jgi:glycogen operon protein
MTNDRPLPSSKRPDKLGARFDADGRSVTFAVRSRHASRITLCLYDADGRRELSRVALERDGDLHVARIEGLKDGARYGLRAEGPYDPARGLFFNPAKLLVDPYAVEIDRGFALTASMRAHAGEVATPSTVDSGPDVPKSVLRRPMAPPRQPRPSISADRRVIYEVLVRGFTKRHPKVPPAQRGTLAGLASPEVIAHLKKLGVTTLELMPITPWIDERHLAPLGLTNAWGYNPILYMAPDPRLAPGGLAEVRDTVDALHAAGFEVLLDVVFNHTGESDILGPSLSLRGLDGPTYFRHAADGELINDTGCGNTLACDEPATLQLVVDSLRHWALAAGIDGFRFDLAATIGRRRDGFDPDHPLLKAIATDEVLADRVLIAEPWDIGPGGYQLGRFRAPWREWNDRFRDDVRRFWRGDAGTTGVLATRLTGSSDIFQWSGRTPSASINFVASHDGFALADTVAFERKHNLANGEGNRDGTDANFSWNHGVEGPTDDPDVRRKRARDVRALLATLLVSRGTPMITAGDELGRTQGGNNNAYAQDNPTTWLDWDNADPALAAFTARLIKARADHAALREDRFLAGQALEPGGIADAIWLSPSGLAMTTAEWQNPDNRVLGLALATAARTEPASRVVVWINGGDADVTVTLPDAENERVWHELADSAAPDRAPAKVEGLATTTIAARSVRLFAVAVDEAGAEVRARRRAGVDPNVLSELADAAGVEREWWGLDGIGRRASPDTLRAILAGMGLAVGSTAQARDSLSYLKARTRPVPRHATPCYQPPALAEDRRLFGLAAHLYALRHDGDCGIGDFETLGRVAESAARLGAALVGVNPFHALFPTDRTRASPYHPSDRRFLDPIYIDVASLPEVLDSVQARTVLDAHASAIAALARRDQVDYPAVSAIKEAVLRSAFETFDFRAERGQLSEALAKDYAHFVAQGGKALADFALFQAIARAAGTTDRARWPAGLSSVADSGVAAARRAHAREVRFALFEQWLADRQLARAADRGRSAGLAIGLYRDLAVGSAPDGAETWTAPADFVSGVMVGAPPDPFSAEGQNWCVPPLNPFRLTETGCAAFRDLVGANMRHAGALRIDHAMSLMRLFFVPDGAKPTEGTYVRYPFEEMLGVLSDESRAARCLVVGEDLGTVPLGFRERTTEAGMLGMRILLFEHDGAEFRLPARYSHASVASFGTHDLPTFAGWVNGRDIDVDLKLGRSDAADAARRREGRRADHARLARMLLAAGWPTEPAWFEAATPPPTLLAALYGGLGSAASALVLVQTDDVANELTALNVPGTDREQPNWRRRMHATVEALETSLAMRAVAVALKGRSGH